MKIETFEVRNEVLKKYISNFYTLTNSKTDEKTNYLVFPHTENVLSIYKNVEVKRTRNRVVFRGNSDIEFNSILYVKFNNPLYVTYGGDVGCISIVFKPLGINAFLDKNLSDYVIDEHSTTFEPFENFKNNVLQLFEISDNETRIKNLENYLISKLIGFEHPFLHQVIIDIENEENQDKTLNEIAIKNNVTQKTLIRHFEKHIGKTPSSYRKIARFRKAMTKHSKESNLDNLLDIANAMNYFDQSHMIKDFKSLTDFNPTDFFSNLSTSNDGMVNMIFPKKGKFLQFEDKL
jgi:AraC-like DNA-binding protein